MMRKKGFSLIEMLVVMAIVCILVGMLLVGMAIARKKARIAKAHTEVSQLAQAWKAYWLVYGAWPTTLDGKTNAPMNSDAMKSLMGLDGKNTKKFMEPNDNVLKDGFKDPWGNLYEVDFSLTGTKDDVEYYQTTVFLSNGRRNVYEKP